MKELDNFKMNNTTVRETAATLHGPLATLSAFAAMVRKEFTIMLR
jgi:hypothetical protein